jgi:hypothetical protein
MSYTQRFSEGFDPLLTEFADSRGPVNFQSAWADMETYHRGYLLLNVGEMQAGATLDCELWEAQDNIGTGAALIAGKAITQLTQAGLDGDDLVGIELRTEEMTPGTKFVQVRVTIAGAAVEFAYTYFGFISRFEPVPTTAYTQIVL